MLEILLKQFGKEDKGFCGATRSIKSEPPPLIELLTWYCGSFRRCRCDMEGKKYMFTTCCRLKIINCANILKTCSTEVN